MVYNQKIDNRYNRYFADVNLLRGSLSVRIEKYLAAELSEFYADIVKMDQDMLDVVRSTEAISWSFYHRGKIAVRSAR